MSSHAKAAKKFIADRERTAWHDQALFFVREKRDRMAHDVPEWEALREMASNMKRHTIANLPYYLEMFEKNATANGIHVHWAKNAEEHNRIVYEIIQKHGGKNLVKSKSMLSEECGLSPYLEARGIDAVESDLGERIMQFMGTPPSHIVLPAIHVKREEVGEVFEKELDSEAGNSAPSYLTRAARAALREKFLHADIAMTGVNFAVASSGAFVVCTNEGNADMGTSFPKVHIAIMGLEKVVPDYDALALYVRLLARSATGQPSTTYTSHYKKPVEGQEMHIVIVDNGRSDILACTEHVNMLKCIRCGSCITTWPVCRRTGGYSYSYFIPGPEGIKLGMFKSPEKYSGNVSACSLCYSCSNVCPVKIDLAEQIYKWRQNLAPLHLADSSKKLMVKGMKFIMNHPGLFYNAIAAGRVAERMPRFVLYNSLDAWGIGRELPEFAKETFNEMWKKGLKAD